MKVKGKMAKDSKETANVRAYLLDHHPDVHRLVREEAVIHERTFTQQLAYIVRGWASVHAEDLDKAIAHVDKWLDGMVLPDGEDVA